MRLAAVLVVLLALGCAPPPAPERATATAPPASSCVVTPATPAASPSAPASAPPPSAVEVPRPAAVSVADAESALFLGQVPGAVVAACASSRDDGARIRCLLEQRYAADPAAAKLALDLYASSGDVAGVQPPELFDGGYRGTIQLVPELPIRALREHLAWVEQGARELDAVYSALGGAYRWRALTVRFFRSVGRTTPNGFAHGWSFAYNVRGSLLHDATAVRELMVHELFHLNDEQHGGWSQRALATLQAEVKARCGVSTACLAPYAPSDTKVRGGTYYAFHADNGPEEYAAELAIRHFVEHRAVLHGQPVKRPFKCGPAPNGAVWRLFVDELWGGTDLVPACP